VPLRSLIPGLLNNDEGDNGELSGNDNPKLSADDNRVDREGRLSDNDNGELPVDELPGNSDNGGGLSTSHKVPSSIRAI
jgi:hypothetical protein